MTKKDQNKKQPEENEESGNAEQQPEDTKGPGNAEQQPEDTKSPGNAEPQPGDTKGPGNAEPQPGDIDDSGNAEEPSGSKSNKTRKKKWKSGDDRREMPFLDHLEELRWRILKSLGSVFLVTVVAFPFTGFLLNFLTLPNDRLSDPAKLIFLKPTGMLVVRMEVALAVGIVISLPVLFYHFWQFVAPGLLPKERKFFLPSMFFTTFCFLAGTAFAYTILIPTVLPFLFGMGTDTIEATINITEYMSFALRLILVSGLIFELPVLAFFLARIGIVTPEFLRKYRRYGIVLVFIFSALLTPPDPASQVLMAFPLLFLYQISIWVSILGLRKKRERDAEWEKELNSDDSESDDKTTSDSTSKEKSRDPEITKPEYPDYPEYPEDEYDD